jgi:hypothetical protein
MIVRCCPWTQSCDRIHSKMRNVCATRALNYGGKHNDAFGISEGCQLVCTSQYNGFLRAIGVEDQQGPPQQHFTVNVNTTENQDFPAGITDLLGTY